MKKGFSLPLWVTACAKSAVKKILGFQFENYELIEIPNNNQKVKIRVYSVGFLKNKSCSIATTFMQSGLDLDLTNNLEIWTYVTLEKIQANNKNQCELINIIPGEGVGRYLSNSKICISEFATELLNINLLDIIPSGYCINLEIIFPNGEFLAERTSNKSFGVVEGLSIIGTTAETNVSASPEQLTKAKSDLDYLLSSDMNEVVTFVIGENGLSLAKEYGISAIVKVGNWLGPLLVYAAEKKVKNLFLLGYHGKLIKLAGGVFHTHNHLADARKEILVYLAFKQNISNQIISKIVNCETIDEALRIIEKFDCELANDLWSHIANTVEQRSHAYVKKYIFSEIRIGVGLFDKRRKIRWLGLNGNSMFSKDNILER